MIAKDTGEFSFLMVPHLSGGQGIPIPTFRTPFPGGEGLVAPRGVPEVVCVKGGIDVTNVGAQTYFHPKPALSGGISGDWSAYAFLPFGWGRSPRLYFSDGTEEEMAFRSEPGLRTLVLHTFGGDEDEKFGRILIALRTDLGEPTSDQSSKMGRDELTARWVLNWGVVSLYFEMRDWSAEVQVKWY